MLILKGTSDTPERARRAALAIGNFDGVHRGHQALLEAARAAVRGKGRLAGAIVFDPHPREVFEPDRPHFRLTTLARKLELLEHFGAGIVVILPFDRALASLSADEFIERVIVRDLAASHLVVGYDFRFGRGRTGTAGTLAEAGRRNGFGLTVVEPVAEHGEAFSSSAIRADLAQGDVAAAAHALGHWWQVEGVVTGGAKRGTGLGFPTANLRLPRGTGLGHGIYAARVLVDGRTHDAAAYLGTRPTFDDGEPILEVFLLDFEGDLYGRTIRVELIDRIRGDLRFTDIEALKSQMQKDCADARRILARTGPRPA